MKHCNRLIFPNCQFTKVFTWSCSAKAVLFWRILENSETKNLCRRLLFSKVVSCRLATLWKRNFSANVFTWILGYFSRHLFNKTSVFDKRNKDLLCYKQHSINKESEISGKWNDILRVMILINFVFNSFLTVKNLTKAQTSFLIIASMEITK